MMNTPSQWRELLSRKQVPAIFNKLYGASAEALEQQRVRYMRAVDQFALRFPEATQAQIFSTPGRTEVGGNHTDHNAGRILAAAVDLDVLAVASPNGSGMIRILSEGFPEDHIDLRDLAPRKEEQYTSAALIRGVCKRLTELGYAIGGFDAYTTSRVLKGSGLSSSAAFEVLVVTMLNHFYNEGRIDEVQNAQIAQYAENVYFGKPCGLMDQTTCAVGGFVTIDFKDFSNPIVRKVDFDFATSGFSLVIVDTGGNHADLNEDYAALEHEMKSVAGALGGKVLRDFTMQDVIGNVCFLRNTVNDRAILRAIHFFLDDTRVVEQVDALQTGNFPRFLQLLIASGYNSWMYCQNCYLSSNYQEQGVSIGLAITEQMLKGCGGWRVHGGGFAGTIQAFVPKDRLDVYLQSMRMIFGANSCHELTIRPLGTLCLDLNG